jgi:UDP-2,3-diacylglucosamine pyrophosphatase LpxH
MAKDHVVVLSDVHIGNNSNTCWYQPSVHEPYLLAALDWIVRKAEMFAEVIVLGDLVDLWTYPPDVRPPSMQDIIAANPAVLGPQGALSRIVRAGLKVTLLLGNHDGTLTPGDLQALRSAVGPVALADPVYVVTGAAGARTAFSHGHYWTMFNAPDDASPWDTLPVGHFVTRAFSYMMVRRLKPGETVADLPNMGYPDGFDLVEFLRSLGPELPSGVAPLLLDYVATTAGMPLDTPIILPRGERTTLAEAKRIYANLFTRWVEKEGGSVVNAGRAALADGDGNYLAWFAQRLAVQERADLVVFGHTHVPLAGLRIAPISYYNSGFECAAKPDTPPKLFTFTVVDREQAHAQIMMVDQRDRAVRPAPVGPLPSAILPPAKDFSCYVRILNRGPVPLTLSQVSASHGYWAVPPPQTIPPGGRGDAWLQDHPGPFGSDGSFTYMAGGRALPFEVRCPTVSDNAARGPGDLRARSGSDWGHWTDRGVPPRGHPLEIVFTWSGA